MAFAVVGFDVGSLTSYIGAARAGGIEVLANEYSDRCTPTCISFSNSSRFFGNAAEQQTVTNLKNTATTFPRLLGKMFADPLVKEEKKYALYNIVPDKNGRAGIEMEVRDEVRILLPEQLLAMHIRRLSEIAEDTLACKVVDIVVNVPTYFVDRERRAVLDACRIAGLNCVRLVNDTTAIGIAYGIYNKDLPAPEEKPRIVSFINLGNACLQVSICAFNKGKMKVLSTSCDPYLGGRNFDMVIFDHAVKEISEKYKLNVMESEKARVRLIKSCEKLKKMMSTNSTEIPMNIECLMEDRDISLKMKREFFEELSKPLLDKFKGSLENVLRSASLQPDNIDYVELVGGGTRIPAIKQIVLDFFGKEGRTTLNADEAVARGCALQAAICSPAYKVREFSITDCCPYPISIDSESSNPSEESKKNVQEEVYPLNSSCPSSKQLTYYRKSDFALSAFYSTPEILHINDRQIGLFKIMNVVPAPPDNVCEVRIKVRVDANGIFSIQKASIIDKVEKEVEVPIEQPVATTPPVESKVTPVENKAEGDSSSANSVTISTETQEPMNVDASAPPPPEVTEQPKVEPKTKTVKKIVARPRDILVETYNMQLLPEQLLEFAEFEADLDQRDKLEKERQHLKNAVEEYVYDMRSKLDSGLKEFILENESEQFSSKLLKTEDWLYGDGEIASRSELSKQLDSLKSVGERYKHRMMEFESRPRAVDALSRSCMHVQKILENYKSGSLEYDHLSIDEMDKVENCFSEKHNYLCNAINVISNMKKTDDPSITSEQLIKEKTSLESLCYPIISRQKPTPPPPVEVDANTNGTSEETVSLSTKTADSNENAPDNLKGNGPKIQEENMDLD